MFLPGEFHGYKSLVGYSPWSRRVSHDLETKWYTSKTIKLLYSYNKYQTELNQVKTQKIHSERMLKMVFPVVMYGCKSWTIKKAECKRTDAFKLWCWRRFLRVPWTARRSKQSILKEINPEYPLEGLLLKLKLQHFGHLMRRANSLQKTLMLGNIEGKRSSRG